MKIPCGFKIRKKVDCDTFIEKCMCKDNTYDIIDNDTRIIIKKDVNENVSVYMKYGDLYDVFNPIIEVARTKDNCYKESVKDYVWKYRKAINEKWFNEKDV
jgi:hypothetical protein